MAPQGGWNVWDPRTSQLNGINLVVDYSEIGQELREELLKECKTKWHATLDRENDNRLRTYQLLKKRFFVWTIPRGDNYQEGKQSAGSNKMWSRDRSLGEN